MLRKSPLKRKTPPRKKSKTGALKRKAWSVFSKYIRERDKYKCFTCDKISKGSGMHSGHMIPRGLSSNLYFDERNVHAQCFRCNIHLFGNSDEYAQRIVQKYGEEELTRIRKAKNVKKAWSREELKDIIKKYE